MEEEVEMGHSVPVIVQGGGGGGAGGGKAPKWWLVGSSKVLSHPSQQHRKGNLDISLAVEEEGEP